MERKQEMFRELTKGKVIPGCHGDACLQNSTEAVNMPDYVVGGTGLY